MPSMGLFVLQIDQAIPEFWQTAATVHTWFPSLVSSGLMGYYFITPSNSILNEPALSFAFIGGMLNVSANVVEETVAPLVEILRDTAGVKFSSFTTAAPDFYTWWSTNVSSGAVGSNVRLGSRLLDITSLGQNKSFIAEKLEGSFNGIILLGHLISGPGVWNARPPGGVGSMTLAWRRTVAHIGKR